MGDNTVMMMMPFWQWLIALVVPALVGFGGVMIGSGLAASREVKQRRLAYLEKQLSQFYSPMLGLRNEVKIHGLFRVEMQTHARRAWDEITQNTKHLPAQEREQISAERAPAFTPLIEFDHSKLNTELLPAYKKMLTLFRDQYWLAEPDAHQHYQSLAEFVETWNRWIAETLPIEVLYRLNHAEESLQLFYTHIEKTHDSIRDKIKSGSPD